MATHWESASTGDIRSALVWLILPAARAVISVDALAPPQRTLSAKTGFPRPSPRGYLPWRRTLRIFVDVAFKLVQSQSQFTHSDMGQNIPAVVERVAVTPSSASRATLSEEAYPVCMTSVWSASGVIENRTAAAHDGQASATPPAETDSTGSDTSRAARSQPANVAPISYVLR